jgi:hypothetical protein
MRRLPRQRGFAIDDSPGLTHCTARLGTRGRVTGGGFHLPVSASDRGA